MDEKKAAVKKYRQLLIDAYYNYKMTEILNPLYEAFLTWKSGQLTHDDITGLIHKVHRQNQQTFSFFTQKQDWLIINIKGDHAWFQTWLQNNPPPPGMEL
jgi:hypothetical protein